ncbi:MAG: GtrA family protein [Clostridiales bacterium]|nr:GtrA family protein [Clostridiales bacterium]
MSTAEEPSRLKKLMKNEKFREIFWYFVFGVLTTLVNLATFALMDKLFDVKWPVKIFKWDLDLFVTFINVVAWVVAIVFAYVTNKKFVFHTKGNVVKEFLSFVAARLFTLFAFELGLFTLGIMVMENACNMPEDDLLITVFGFDVTNKYIVKLFIAVFVVVANYIFSKLFIFKKKKSAEPSAEEQEKTEDPTPAETAEAKAEEL